MHFIAQNIIRIFSVLFLLVTSPLAIADEDTTKATQVVEQFQAELLSSMQSAKELKYQERYEKLKPAVTESHDLAGIAQIAVGRFWKDFSDTQKQELVDAFSQLSIATYTSRFDGFSGEQFKTVSSEALPRGEQIVRTLLIKTDGEEIHLDYVLRNKNDRWLIINIIAQGVSDLGIKRAEYSRILAAQDFDTLIAKLKEKIERNTKADE